MPLLVPNRICIYPKDIQNITGKKDRTARKIISDLKRKLGKKKNELVTVREYCEYAGLKEEEVMKFFLY